MSQANQKLHDTFAQVFDGSNLWIHCQRNEKGGIRHMRISRDDLSGGIWITAKVSSRSFDFSPNGDFKNLGIADAVRLHWRTGKNMTMTTYRTRNEDAQTFAEKLLNHLNKIEA